MEKIVVSIIIPVYNAEQYIAQCLDSLLGQTYPYFEIICVDDGSTDQSFNLLKEYEEKDRRITVIRQSNQYAGVARNRGLEIAQGKYLLFLDADDFFHPEMLEQAVTQAEKDKTEILIFDVFQFDNTSRQVVETTWCPLKKGLFGEGVKSAAEISDVIFDFATSAPWNKLFLADFIRQNDLRFQPIQRSNDLYFVFGAFACANRIGLLDRKLIYYRDNNADSLQGSGFRTPTVYAEALYALKELLEKRGLLDIFGESFRNMAISISVYNLNNMKTQDSYRELYRALCDEIFPRLHLGIGWVEAQVEKAICAKEELIIYGAGTLAVAIVNFLLYECGYTKGKISLAVSNSKNNLMQVKGIVVREFSEICSNSKNRLVMIAVSDCRIQEEIEKDVRKSGFVNTAKIGFHEFAALVREHWNIENMK